MRQKRTEKADGHLLAGAIRQNVIRLRARDEITQRELSRRIRAQGIRDWAPDTIAMIEVGKRRADRIGEIAALCAAFQVTVAELIACDHPVTLEETDLLTEDSRGNPLIPRPPVSTRVIALALDGKMPQPDIAALDDLDEVGGYDAERQAAQALGLDSYQFTALARRAIAGPFWSFGELRDQRAGITKDMPDSSIRARRGHATRNMLVHMKSVMDEVGIETIVAEHNEQYRLTRERAKVRERQERIDTYEQVSGMVFRPEDFPELDDELWPREEES